MAADSYTCTVLFFANAADIVGARSIAIEVSCGATVEDVMQLVCEQFPKLSALRPTLAFALNDQIVPSSARVEPDATVAILPPVSGG